MAVVTHAVGTADTGATPNTSGAFTPAVNDLLVFFVQASATVQATATLTSSISGIKFIQVVRSEYGAATHSEYCFVADKLIAGGEDISQTVDFDTASDSATGTVIYGCAVSGMSRAGLSAIRQSAVNNGGAGSTPAPSFSIAALTGNPTLGAVSNQTNPSAMTEPSGWTEGTADLGYAGPTSGCEYVFRNSGFTGTTITWGSTSATVHGDIIVELDSTPNDPSRMARLQDQPMIRGPF